MDLRFRASGAADLMTSKQGSGITQKQLERLDYLKARMVDKGLTDNMTEEYNTLLVKKNAPIELSDTAKSFVEKIWRKREKNVEEFLSNKYLEKGLSEEENGVSLVGRIDKNLYKKNEEFFDNGVLCGTPDIIWDEFIIDIKCSWNLETFMNASVTPLYYGQLQIYMELTGTKKSMLRYCLIDTPSKLIEDEERRVMWKLGITDETLDEYAEVFETIRRNMLFSHYPDEERVKTFEIAYDPLYIDELYNRCKLAIKYYQSIALGGVYVHTPNKFKISS